MLARINGALYQRLRKLGVLDQIPKKAPLIPDALAYYREHYDGATTSELRRKDRPLYDRLCGEGLLNLVPGYHRRSSIEDPIAYYRQHYEGVTRGRLAETNASLYKQLWRKRLLSHVPSTHKPQRSIRDALAYYREHYNGLNQAELRTKDPVLYRRLEREGTLNEVSAAKKDRAKNRRILNLLVYYRENYAGLTRGQLASEDFALYRRLLRAGQINCIPKA